ncbi:MAG: hypothetical protein ACI4F7_05055 [Acutalibacteraceae bacterium]
MKKIFLIITLAALVLIGGCKDVNTESAEFSSQISSSVSGSQITEFEAESHIAEESSSELSAPSALSSETVSEVNSKPAATQNQETSSKNSVSRSSDNSASKEPSVGKADSSQTSNNLESEYIPVKNATAADTKEVADKVIFYLNKARAEIGSGELTKLSGLTRYAEYRSGQLISNFAHDPGDWNKAAEATGYGKYIDLSEYGNPQGYYDIGAREAIAMTGIVGSTDRIAETLAQIIIDSPRHWAYVGSDEMKYSGVGVSCNADMWYAAIMVTNTTAYEN